MASSFSTLRQRGYGTFYAVKIEGIPYIFTEGPVPYRVDYEGPPGVPTRYTGQSASFLIVDDSTIDQELDRESSVARAKSMSLVLSWDVLEAEGILDDLFRRPAYFTTLREDVGATDTTIKVVSTAGFSGGGQFYIGRELVKYSSSSANSFLGCTRGYIGYEYKFRMDDPGSHGMVTPTPHSWRGRFVTIYEHIVSPEGRILDSTWTEGTYQRELWKGYITAPPVPSQLGMKIEVANLVRLAGQELGSSLHGTTVGMDQGSEAFLDLPVYVAEGASIQFVLVTVASSAGAADPYTLSAPLVETGAVAGDYPKLAPGVMTVRQYLEAAAERLEAEWPTGAGGGASLEGISVASAGNYPNLSPPYGTQTQIEITYGNGTPLVWAITAVPSSGCYWFYPASTQNYGALAAGSAPSDTPGEESVFHIIVPLLSNHTHTVASGFGLPIPYLAVKDIEGDSALDFTLPATGIGVVEAGDFSEVMRWDEKITVDYLGADISPYMVLHISERMVGAQYASVAQIPANLYYTGTIEVASGKVGTLDDVAETILESSGTGERGSKDTLALGFGLGVPEDWIDMDAVGGAPITAEEVPLLAIGRASWQEIFSGWYQLSGWCLALRRNTSNVLQFQRVNVVPSEVISTTVAGYLGTALGKSDVVVGGTQVPRVIIAPNQVMIDTTAGPYESAQYTYNAVGRIQSEGVHSTEMAVPGGRAEILSAAVLNIMSRGQGQSCIRFAVAPWIDIQVGDPISVTVAHPLLFKWLDGTREPANIPGRCVGWSFNMKTGEQSLTILLDGLQAPGVHLCPVEVVSLVSSNDVTVGDGTWWNGGETVRFYNRGLEATESADLLVDSISGNVLTLNASPPAWLAATTRATHPAYTAGSADQTGPFMYDHADRFWRF